MSRLVPGLHRPGAGPLESVVVVGASLAGLRACEALRTGGFSGRLTLVGAEEHLPYDRPPLSKQILAGDWEPARILLRAPEAVAELALDLRLGVRAGGLDVDGRAVHLVDGAEVPFDGLVIATGARPRRLPGQATGAHELRTLEDSLALRERLHDGASVVVIGAGFIGLEVAATARRRGAHVTVLEGLAAPLQRVLGAELGAAATLPLVESGIDVRCGVGVASVAADRVVLADGGELAADVVVVGVGVAPATDWLATSGLELRDGVVCDAGLRTGVRRVYAAGDVARWTPPSLGRDVRIEHWTNAAEQGAAAAANLLAEAGGAAPAAFDPVPFFWSDMGRHRLQFLGHADAGDGSRSCVAVGDPASGRFVALYGRGDRLTAVLGANVPKLVMAYRPLLARGASWSEALALGDEQRAAQQT